MLFCCDGLPNRMQLAISRHRLRIHGKPLGPRGMSCAVIPALLNSRGTSSLATPMAVSDIPALSRLFASAELPSHSRKRTATSTEEENEVSRLILLTPTSCEISSEFVRAAWMSNSQGKRGRHRFRRRSKPTTPVTSGLWHASGPRESWRRPVLDEQRCFGLGAEAAARGSQGPQNRRLRPPKRSRRQRLCWAPVPGQMPERPSHLGPAALHTPQTADTPNAP